MQQHQLQPQNPRKNTMKRPTTTPQRKTQMDNLSKEFKKRIANLYSKRKQKLDEIDPQALELFASEVLDAIKQEKEKAQSSHDLEVLEQSMKHLKQDSVTLRKLKPNTDDYDFTRNDCKSLINSTKRWLKIEKLI
jgi:hypothetical protein